jgi:hypothetical protein
VSTDSTEVTRRTVGEIVGYGDAAKYPGRWKVIKRNKTTVDLEPLDGQQVRGNCLRTYDYMLTDAPAAPKDGEPVQPVIGRPFVEWFDTGQIVTSTHPKLAGLVLVVTRDAGKDKVSVGTLFGGDAWGVPRSLLKPFETTELIRRLLLEVYEHADGGDEQRSVSQVREMLTRAVVRDRLNKPSKS